MTAFVIMKSVWNAPTITIVTTAVFVKRISAWGASQQQTAAKDKCAATKTCASTVPKTATAPMEQLASEVSVLNARPTPTVETAIGASTRGVLNAETVVTAPWTNSATSRNTVIKPKTETTVYMLILSCL